MNVTSVTATSDRHSNASFSREPKHVPSTVRFIYTPEDNHNKFIRRPYTFELV